MSDASTKQSVECPICGDEFDPTVAGGWCTNTECGEWQYTEGGTEADTTDTESIDSASDEPEDDGFASSAQDEDEDTEAVDLFEDSDDADEAAGGDDSEAAKADEAEDPVDDTGEADDVTEKADDTDDSIAADETDETAERTEAAEATEADEAEAAADDTADVEVAEADDASGVADDTAKAESTEKTHDTADADTIDCPDCGADLDADANFCVECGADVSAVSPGSDELDACPGCGSDVEPKDNFCVNCGEDLDAHRGGTDDHDDAIDALEANASDDDSAETPASLVLEVEGREIHVDDGDTVGREIRAALTEAGRPDDEAVRIHREHVRFVRENDSFYLLDLGDNPTQINGQTLQKGDREPVGPGDELELSGVASVTVQAP